MAKWTVSKDEVELYDFVVIGIDFDIESVNAHWSKVEVYGMDADEALRLAHIIAAALNEQEPSDG